MKVSIGSLSQDRHTQVIMAFWAHIRNFCADGSQEGLGHIESLTAKAHIKIMTMFGFHTRFLLHAGKLLNRL